MQCYLNERAWISALSVKHWKKGVENSADNYINTFENRWSSGTYFSFSVTTTTRIPVWAKMTLNLSYTVVKIIAYVDLSVQKTEQLF